MDPTVVQRSCPEVRKLFDDQIIGKRTSRNEAENFNVRASLHEEQKVEEDLYVVRTATTV
jgi:hypothetical protein